MDILERVADKGLTMSYSESSGTHEYARGRADERKANLAEIERLTKEHAAALGNADTNYQRWVEALAEIERLEAAHFEADDKRCHLQNENERLLAVLKPFAEACETFDIGQEDVLPLMSGELCLGEFRAARRAYEQKTTEK
ncbi:MAG: hypothetical protein Q7N50_09960 [Armatimonadota bacterium]|nr:hypothetical protein [Armatimonadota bacterium]